MAAPRAVRQGVVGLLCQQYTGQQPLPQQEAYAHAHAQTKVDKSMYMSKPLDVSISCTAHNRSLTVQSSSTHSSSTQPKRTFPCCVIPFRAPVLDRQRCGSPFCKRVTAAAGGGASAQCIITSCTPPCTTTNTPSPPRQQYYVPFVSRPPSHKTYYFQVSHSVMHGRPSMPSQQLLVCSLSD